MFKIFGISNTGDFSVCGKNVDANLCLPPPSIPPLKGAGSVGKLLRFIQKPTAPCRGFSVLRKVQTVVSKTGWSVINFNDIACIDIYIPAANERCSETCAEKRHQNI